MGEQTLVLADYMCREKFPPAKIGASGRVPHKAQFRIDGYDITATSNYTFHKKATGRRSGGDTLIPESFSSQIELTKSDGIKVLPWTRTLAGAHPPLNECCTLSH
eukprot:GHVU01231501.1.p1 GENE.GHVU01231501.1~~GHVU01231501.1.p1  ORF type:complete len:123 (+),score=4.01 GHVU01231501.1:55-369(+)